MRCSICGEPLDDPAYYCKAFDIAGNEHAWFLHEDCADRWEQIVAPLGIVYDRERMTVKSGHTVFEKLE